MSVEPCLLTITRCWTASLGVGNEIRRAYRELSKRYHPDNRSATAIAIVKFQQLNEAYAAQQPGRRLHTT